MAIQVNAIKGIIDSIGNGIDSVDELITSKEESKIQDNKLADLRNDLASIQKDIIGKTADLEISLNEQKAKVLNAEATGNKLQRLWRPILMLCFGGIIVYQYFLVHLINGIIGGFNGTFAMPVLDFPDRFWGLLELGIGGYIAGRSLEKITPNIVSTVIGARESKRDLDLEKIKLIGKEQRQHLRTERKENRMERKEERQDNREERRSDRQEKRADRKNKKLLRRERGRLKIRNFFNNEE